MRTERRSYFGYLALYFILVKVLSFSNSVDGSIIKFLYSLFMLGATFELKNRLSQYKNADALTKSYYMIGIIVSSFLFFALLVSSLFSN